MGILHDIAHINLRHRIKSEYSCFKMVWQTTITNVAGAYNLSIIVFCRGFTSKCFFQGDPNLFDVKGVLFVLLWGAAYLSVASEYASVPYAFLVFTLEKLFYGVYWINWLRKRNQWVHKVQGDALANTFFHIYGLGDILSGLAFFLIFITSVWDKLTQKGVLGSLNILPFIY